MPEDKTEPKPPEWEHRQAFRINEQMRHVVTLAVSAANSELKMLRRKLEKLQYGS